MTVNKALTQLAKAGLIERKRRSGSFVSFPQSQAAILEIHDIRDEVAALGVAYRFELTSRRERLSGPADAKHIDMPRHTPLIELVCRHYAGKRVLPLKSASSVWMRFRQPRRPILLKTRRGHGWFRACHGAVQNTRYARLPPRRRMRACSVFRWVRRVW